MKGILYWDGFSVLREVLYRMRMTAEGHSRESIKAKPCQFSGNGVYAIRLL